jgi:hypothetical protein
MLGGQASHAFIVSWLSPVSLEAAARLQGPVSPATTTNHEAEDDFPGAWTSPSRNLMDLSQYEWWDMGCMLSHVFCQMEVAWGYDGHLRPYCR